MKDIILTVKDLKVYFKVREGYVHAVDGVSFDIYGGETFCLVGESGCGKSTLARSIVKLLPENAEIKGGEVLFNGRDLISLDEKTLQKIRGKEITFIFQNPHTYFNPVYNIEEQMVEAIIPHIEDLSSKSFFKRRKEKREKARSIALELLRTVGIPDPEKVLKMYPHELSGGMKQRVMIATAVATNPTLLIADEPTTALDVTIQAQILDLLNNIKEKFGLSVLFITHDLGIVAEVADRVGVMYAGNIVEIAEVRELFVNPMHPYTTGLLGAVPKPTEKVEKLEYIPGVVPDLIEPPEGCLFYDRCPIAEEVCRREKPKLVEVRSNHFVACHLRGVGNG